MKNHMIKGALAFATIGSLSAQVTVSSDNFSYRSTGVFGTPDAGLIVINPDEIFNNGFANPPAAGTSIEIPLRWLDIDLDGDLGTADIDSTGDGNADLIGAQDDYIDFTIRYTTNSGVCVSQGQGVSSNGTGFYMTDGEEMLVEIINVSTNLPTGAATFDGFTEAGLGGGAAGAPVFFSTDFEANGVAANYTESGAGNPGDYRYLVGRAAISAAQTVYFNNLVNLAVGQPAPGATMGETITNIASTSVRDFDISFTYDPAGTPVSPSITLTTDNLRVFLSGTTLTTAQNAVSENGIPFGASVIVNPDAGFDAALDAPNGGSVSFDLPLRLDLVELNGDNLGDEYVNFTMRVHSLAGSGARISGGNGFGYNSGNNWGLDTDDAGGIYVEVLYPELSPGISGAVVFDGFTQASMMLSGNAGTELQTLADGSLDINGVAVNATVDGTGFQTGFANRSFFPTPVPGVSFDNPVYNANTPGATIFEDMSPTAGIYARDFDLKFTYLPEGTPAAIPTNEFCTDTNVNLRSGGVFGGLQSDGSEIVTAPGFDLATVAAAQIVDIPLVWDFLDIDNDGNFTESIAFTLRLSSLAGGNIVLANDGFHVNGNGPSNNSIDGTEGITLQVLYPVATGLASGAVEFVGFNSGGVIVLGTGPDETTVTTGTATIDVNGTTLTGTLPNPGSGDGGVLYENVQPSTNLIPAAETLTFNNSTFTPGTVTPSVKVRSYNFCFAYSPDFTEGESGPAGCTDIATGFGIRGNGEAYFNGNNTNVLILSDGSEISAITDTGVFDATLESGAEHNYPFVWSFLDIDGDGNFDDTVEFTVRVTSNGGDLVKEGQGIFANPVYGLGDGESLTYEIIPTSVSTGQTVFFEFTSGTFLMSGNSGDEVTPIATTGDASVNINGNTASGSLNEPLGGYTNVQPSASVAPASTLVFDNVVRTAGTVTPNVFGRQFSFRMCYSEATTTPSTPLEITACAYNSATDFSITFNGDAGATYKITGTSDLSAGFTNDLVTGITGGTGVSQSFDPGANTFFRVEEE
ncbi:MAG: hypothetical protein AAGC74_10210 [Verrucomicrobiota bacterium]